MKKKTIPVVILKTRTGYSAHSPAIDGLAVTGKTIDKTLKLIKEAAELHIEELHLMNSQIKFATKTLKSSIAEYGTDAFYATITIAA